MELLALLCFLALVASWLVAPNGEPVASTAAAPVLATADAPA